MRTLTFAMALACAGCTKGTFLLAPDGGDVSTDAGDGGNDTTDGGTSDAIATAPTEALYLGACLSKLAAGRVDRVLRFYTVVTYAPSALTLNMTALSRPEAVSDVLGPRLRHSLQIDGTKLAIDVPLSDNAQPGL